VTLDPDQQTRLAGFRALIYSRPIVLVVEEDRSTLIVPEIEADHAKEAAIVDEVIVYTERPDASASSSPLDLLDSLLDRLPAGSSIAIDEDRLPYGLVQRFLSSERQVLPISGTLRELQEIKWPEEIEAVRHAGQLLAVGVKASLDACRPGVSELEVDAAGASAMLAEASSLGPDTTVDLLSMTPSGPDRSILPHVFSSTRRLQKGDVLIHTRQLAINGYRAELERTAIIGPPTGAQAHAFETMVRSQEAATARLAPGVPFSEIDNAARSVIEDGGYGEHFIHRTGHGIAISVHEHPHLRYDNDNELRPGMVITIEPGFYVAGLGGFRHSDTWTITSTGAEALTSFPSSLEQLSLGDG